MSAQTAEGAHTPAYWAPRRALFEDLYAKQLESFKAKRTPILVQAVKRLTALDGADEVRDVTCTGFFTKPIDLLPLASAPAASLDALKADLATHSESTPTQRIPSTVGAKVVVVARVNGTKLWDLTRPLEEPVDLLEFIYWSDAAPEKKEETPADDSNDIDELDEETQNLARHVFWHSSAHMLGYAMEKALEPCKLHHGPALDAIFSKKAVDASAAPADADLSKLSGYPMAVQLHKMCSKYTKSDKLVTGGGFFYEASVASAIKESTEFKKLEKQIGAIQRENHQFQRLVLTKPEAIALFNDNPLKQKWIEKSTETEGDACVLTAYRCGDFIDLCRGPHVISTGVVRKVVLTKVGGVHSASAEECLQLEGHKMCLQRVYGISFPTNALAKVYAEYFERASTQLDHKTVGIGHALFNTSVDMACPGSAFFFPHGTRIYNSLMTFMRKEYTKRGYEEVITANIYDKKLWKTSGHWDKYRDNLFLIANDSASNAQGTAADAPGDNADSSMAVKPMNCPGHCVLFGLKAHSYKSLPLRYAEFGVLHRNEVRGALRGLTRVTRFVQDDAHIFCTPYQLHAEIGRNLDFLGFVYEGVLGFTDYKLMLSTKPANKLYIGEDAIWELAESKLQSALNAFCFARVAQAIRTLLPDSGCAEHDGWWPLVDGSSGEAAAESPVAQFWGAYGFEMFAYDGSPLSIARVQAFRKEIREELKQAKVRGPASTSPLKKFVADLINHEGAYALMVSVFETKLWVLNEGEGAFYGPKIDVEVCDSMGRSHQLGTTQLDFNLPQRFDLKYAEKTSNAAAQSEVTRPIMIHRAILGSIERCIGILTEHYEGGKRWPLWLSPRQIMIVPISKYQFDYAARLRKVFESPEVYGEAGSVLQGGDVDLAASVNACTLNEGQFADVPGFYCDADLSENKLDKKIRNAQQAYYNFIFVVGREEAESGCVNVRARDNTQLGIHKVEDVLKMMHKLRKQFWRHDTVPGWGE